MQCPQCQTENPPRAKFCLECATPLLRRCVNCGTQLPVAAKFCPECARPVTASATTQSRFTTPELDTPKYLAEKILTSRALPSKASASRSLCGGPDYPPRGPHGTARLAADRRLRRAGASHRARIGRSLDRGPRPPCAWAGSSSRTASTAKPSICSGGLCLASKEHPLEPLHGESGILACLCLLARALIAVGEFVLAMDRAKEAIRIGEAADAATHIVHGHFALGSAYLCKGDLERALPTLERGLGIARARSVSFMEPFLCSAVGSAYAQSRRIAEGISLLELGLSGATRMGLKVQVITLRGWLAAGYLLDRAPNRCRHAGPGVARGRAPGGRTPLEADARSMLDGAGQRQPSPQLDAGSRARGSYPRSLGTGSPASSRSAQWQSASWRSRSTYAPTRTHDIGQRGVLDMRVVILGGGPVGLLCAMRPRVDFQWKCMAHRETLGLHPPQCAADQRTGPAKTLNLATSRAIR